MPRQTTDLIFVHCSATKPSMDTDIKDIDRWHRERGFLKVGYHFVIKRDGTLQKGRELMEAGAHVKSYNHRSIGLCLIGGVSETNVDVWENNFLSEQWATLYNLIVDLKEKFPEVNSGIIHRLIKKNIDLRIIEIDRTYKTKPYVIKGKYFIK